MTIRNLTGTTWYFNSTLAQGDFYKDLTFVCNGQTYDTIFRYKAQTSWGNEDEFEYFGSVDVTAYKDGAWRNQAYRTITITGGDDATDSTLISWIQSNATYRGIATDFEWNLQQSLDTGTQIVTWNINFTTNNTAFPNTHLILNALYGGSPSLPNSMAYFNGNGEDILHYSSGQWTVYPRDIITVTDGTDITNHSLLAWLQNNSGAPSVGAIVQCKVDNIWKEGEPKIKANNAWKDVSSICIKQNNTWTET